MPVRVSKEARTETSYTPVKTIELFHKSGAQIRCIVGPVGSGKTVGAAWEILYYIPMFLRSEYDIRKTRWVVVRNTYSQLQDTTQKTIFEWFPFGTYFSQERRYVLSYPDKGIEIELLFRSCDQPRDMKKFKSLELTGYWIDESIEVDEGIKRMLKNRIGRYPRMSPVRFGIETTNPPDVDDPTYSMFEWKTYVPGPPPPRRFLAKHEGFWQEPYENEVNLRPGYYDDMREDYRDSPDWISRYIEGKPGILQEGKPVYSNYRHDEHEVDGLEWYGNPLFIGLDHSGNLPAAVVVEPLANRVAHVLMEFWTERLGIVDFGHLFMTELRKKFPGAVIGAIWGDPAGSQQYSRKEGGFTSNSKLLQDECGIDVQPSEQNPTVRIQAVEQMLARSNAVRIDSSCRRLIAGFMGGYVYPEYMGGRFGEKPIKNRYSHVHDALQYVFVKLYGVSRVRRMTDDEAKMYEEIDRRQNEFNPLVWGFS